jgi:hypothetical protein
MPSFGLPVGARAQKRSMQAAGNHLHPVARKWLRQAVEARQSFALLRHFRRWSEPRANLKHCFQFAAARLVEQSWRNAA